MIAEGRIQFVVASFVKNVSSSISDKKLRLYVFPSLHMYRNLRKIISSTFIYEPILIKNYMNANIMNTQIFNLIQYDPKGN